MKKQLVILTLFLSLGATSLLADESSSTNAAVTPTTGFQIGNSSFPKGDSIEITSVERSQDLMVVKGHYKLVSADRAQLALYITTHSAISVPTDAKQLMHISKGEGDFELTHDHLVPGLAHVTMYSVPGGKGFAGVYFGNKEEAAEESKMDLGYYNDETTESPATPPSASGRNQALLEYLGNPVEPPADMDARYTKNGLINAIQLAADKAGITVKRVEIDDSEFPFIVAVVCGGSDWSQLKAQLSKMEGYNYTGGIGGGHNSDGRDSCSVINIVPYQACPPGTHQHIYHRLGLREQVFYDKINQR